MNMNDKPIIKYFKIIGLHGYKDVVIDFNSPVRIVIAENGAGKTTILSALYFFLTSNFNKLRTIDFEEIVCVFQGSDEEVTLKKKILVEIPAGKMELVDDIAMYSDADEASIISYVTTEFIPEDIDDMRQSYIARDVYGNSPWDWETIHEMFSNILEHYEATVDDEIREVAKKVKTAIGDTEILYLPTYRRIEKLFNKGRRKKTRSHRYTTFKNRLSESVSTSSQMNYGLADVEDRLTALTENVQRRTNLGYREISVNIIDDLLAGKADRSKFSVSDLPDQETLKLFFSRIGGEKNRGDSYFERIRQIYDQENNQGVGDRETLMYFLSKLSQVVNQTKQLESTIENFVNKANTYLGNTSDGKSFSYDPERMKVDVISKWTSEEIKLNDLSSGEKQVVSLLSYIFLYPSEKIILVDEPELSLSIEWQQRILVDLMESPSCKQLLAITHSPFIFDNELDPYGSPLKIQRKNKKEKSKE